MVYYYGTALISVTGLGLICIFVFLWLLFAFQNNLSSSSSFVFGLYPSFFFFCFLTPVPLYPTLFPFFLEKKRNLSGAGAFLTLQVEEDVRIIVGSVWQSME
jgi:hypothetical protein